jgi:hypothetical protein
VVDKAFELQRMWEKIEAQVRKDATRRYRAVEQERERRQAALQALQVLSLPPTLAAITGCSYYQVQREACSGRGLGRSGLLCHPSDLLRPQTIINMRRRACPGFFLMMCGVCDICRRRPLPLSLSLSLSVCVCVSLALARALCQEELVGMKLSELQRRARSVGVAEAAVEEAADSEQPKDAVTALVVEAEAKAREEAAVAAAAGASERRAGGGGGAGLLGGGGAAEGITSGT